MKSQFLKIAGVKNDQEFYKLFPSEASFFKKHPKAKQYIQKAQNGNIVDSNNNTIPDYLEYNNSQDFTNNFYKPINSIPQVNANFPVTNNVSSFKKQDLEGVDTSAGTLPVNKVAGKSSGMLDKMGGVGGIAESVGGIVQGFQMLKEGKKAKNEANQFNEYSKVALMASQTKPEEIKRKYNRPEDNIISGDQLFPINGVGTNVLAKNGYSIPEAQGGYEMTDGDYSQIGSMGSQLYNNLTDNQFSGGSKIGGSIGKLAGTSIGGPIGGMIGEIGGNIIGGALDNTARQTRKYQDASKRNIDQMFLQDSFKGSQQMNRSYMEDGGDISQLEESGQLETVWGGDVEPISNNPYTGETLMFRGQSHAETDSNGNSGIGINYGNNPVEVERGEPATVLSNPKTGEENLVIFGNLKIPKFAHDILQDPKAHNKKFKNYVADLAKEETKLNKYIETSKTNIESLKGTTSFDKIELESNNIKLQGAMMKLKDIANKKQSLSEFQNIINDTAEEHGFKADDLAKGKITRDTTKSNELKEAMYGYEIPSFQGGGGVKKVKNLSVANNLKNQGRNKDGFFGKVTPTQFEDFKKKNTWYDFTNFDPKDIKDTEDFQNKFKQLAKEYNYDASYFKNDGLFGDQTTTAQGDFIMSTRPKSVKSDPLALSASQNAALNKTSKTDKKEDNRPIINYKKNQYIDAFNQVLPFLRPSNATDLDGNQLLGEMYGMSSNQLEPVQSQNYRPELRTPYDISYQDQLNEITASERAAQRMSAYNPEASAQIAAQSYQGKSKVLADQFRANQAMKENIYSQNTQTLNDAQLKNLAINDTQYTRQEQAKSNTKAINQAILNSVSSKYQQNKLENRTLSIQENMYNYRFDKSGRAINMNGIYQPNVDQGNYNYDKNGKPTSVNLFTNGKFSGIRNLTDEEYNSLEPKENNNSELTPIQPSLSTRGINSISQISTISDMEKQRIEEEKQSIANSSMKNGGFISNSSLVRSLK